MNDIEIKLRPWKFSDLPSLVHHANSPNISQWMTDRFPHPYSDERGMSFIKLARSKSPCEILAITVNDEAIGSIGVHPLFDIYRHNAELGYWLSEEYWGKGVMTKAIRLMTDYAFSNFEFTRIFAKPFEHNPASQRVLEKSGFELEYKLKDTVIKNGKSVSERCYAIRKNEQTESSGTY